MSKYVILLLILITSGDKIPTKESPDTITKHIVTLENLAFEKILSEYYLENLAKKNKGVITVYLEENTDKQSFVVSSSYWEDLKKYPPSHYAILENIPVLFYSGIEKYIRLDSTYLSNIVRDISPFLIEYVEDEKGNILQMPTRYWAY
jgi:hypothetical protein